MHVLTVASIVPRKMGGFEKYCCALTKALTDRGDQHTLIFAGAPSEEVSARLEDYGATISPLRVHGSLRETLKLAAAVRKLDVDIVHLHYVGPVNGLSLCAPFLDARVVFSDRISSDIVTASIFKKFLKRLRYLLALRAVSAFISVSDYCRRKLSENCQIPIARVDVIYNSVNVDSHSSVAHREKENPTLVTVASLIPEKGVQDIISCLPSILAEIPSCRLVIIGDGHFRKELQALAVHLNVEESVSFLGFRTDVPEVLGKADVAIVPSLWEEAFGYATVEAMASGLAVIATRRGATPELITDGVTGCLYMAGDRTELSAICKDLLRDPARRQRLGTAARQSVLERFSYNTQIEATLEVYSRCIKKLPGRE